MDEGGCLKYRRGEPDLQWVAFGITGESEGRLPGHRAVAMLI